MYLASLAARVFAHLATAKDFWTLGPCSTGSYQRWRRWSIAPSRRSAETITIQDQLAGRAGGPTPGLGDAPALPAASRRLRAALRTPSPLEPRGVGGATPSHSRLHDACLGYPYRVVVHFLPHDVTYLSLQYPEPSADLPSLPPGSPDSRGPSLLGTEPPRAVRVQIIQPRQRQTPRL